MGYGCLKMPRDGPKCPFQEYHSISPFEQNPLDFVLHNQRHSTDDALHSIQAEYEVHKVYSFGVIAFLKGRVTLRNFGENRHFWSPLGLRNLKKSLKTFENEFCFKHLECIVHFVGMIYAK